MIKIAYLYYVIRVKHKTNKNMRNGLDISTLKKIEAEFGNFEIKQISGGDNDVYFRFGYWNSIDIDKLQSILGGMNEVVEDVDYDDDCGHLFMYRLK